MNFKINSRVLAWLQILCIIALCVLIPNPSTLYDKQNQYEAKSFEKGYFLGQKAALEFDIRIERIISEEENNKPDTCWGWRESPWNNDKGQGIIEVLYIYPCNN